MRLCRQKRSSVCLVGKKGFPLQRYMDRFRFRWLYYSCQLRSLAFWLVWVSLRLWAMMAIVCFHSRMLKLLVALLWVLHLGWKNLWVNCMSPQLSFTQMSCLIVCFGSYAPLYTALTTGILNLSNRWSSYLQCADPGFCGSLTTFSTWQLQVFGAWTNLQQANRSGFADVCRSPASLSSGYADPNKIIVPWWCGIDHNHNVSFPRFSFFR